MSSDVTDLAAQLLSLRDQKTEGEAALSMINEEISIIQAKMIGAMGDLTAFKAHGHNFSRISTLSASKTDEDACFDWLEANGYGDSIKRNIHHRTLNRIVGEVMEELGTIPDGVATSTFDIISVRKS